MVVLGVSILISINCIAYTTSVLAFSLRRNLEQNLALHELA